MEQPEPSPVWPALIAMAVTTGLLAWSLAERPSPAAEQQVRGLYREVLGEGSPRPTGSRSSSVARAKIEAALRAAHYEVEPQRRWHCAANGTCAEVHNLIAVKAGTSSGAVLLAAHHDTVPASPGALDDGAGVVSLLYVAAALARAPPAERGVIFLFTDAEELALNGARLFAESHPLFGRVKAAMAVEAMGGPTFVGITKRRARAAALPFLRRGVIGTSAYSLLADAGAEDSMVFEAHGVPSVVVIGTGSSQAYHTPLDRPANVDHRAVAARAEKVLAWTSLLASAPLAADRHDRAVYFDLAGRFLVWWPQGWTPWIAALVLLAWVGAPRGGLAGDGRQRAQWATIGALRVPLAIGLSLAWMVALRKAGAFGGMWIALPAAVRLTMVLVPAGALVFLERRLAQGVPGEARVRGAWIGSAVVGAVAAFVAPEISYLFLAPAALGALIGLVPWRPAASWGRILWIALPPLILAAALVYSATQVLLLINLGPNLVVASVLAGAIAAPLVPLVSAADRAFAPAALGLSLALAAASALVERTIEPPIRQLSVRYHQEPSGAGSFWFLGELAAVSRDRGALDPKPVPWWTSAPVWRQETERRLASTPPELVVRSTRVAEDRVTIDAVARTTRGADQLVVALPPEVDPIAVWIEGQPIAADPSARARAGGWQVITLIGSVGEGVAIRFDHRRGAPLEVQLTDLAYGLPEDLAAITELRARGALPAHVGDATMISRRIRLWEAMP